MNDTEQNLSSQQTNGSWFDRWFDNSPILPTGQKRIAYQIAAFCALLTIALDVVFAFTINKVGIEAGTALGGILILDVILCVGLFAGEQTARNFTLFRSFVGAFVTPFIIWAQIGIIMAAFITAIGLVLLAVNLLLLKGTTTKLRISQAVSLQLTLFCISVGIISPLVSGFLAYENPLEVRCDVETYSANEKSPNVKFPIQTIYKPGITTKSLDEFRFAVDYEYNPTDQTIRHSVTISVTASDTGELLGEQNIDYLTNWIVQSVWNTMPHRNVYFATGWVTIQHPITHRNLRYVCIPYAYQVNESDGLNVYERLIRELRLDQRR